MKFQLKTDFKTRMPRVFKRGKIYYIRQRLNGRDTWRSLQTKNRDIAEKLAYRIWFYQQGKAQKALLDEPMLRIGEISDMYKDTERFKLLAESTKLTMLERWDTFLTWCDERGITELQQIGKQDIEKYLESREVKNKTFNNIRNDLKQVMAPACIHVKMKNPADQVQQRSITRGEKASNSFRAFMDNEVLKIFKELPKSSIDHKDEWLTACIIAANTGLRYKDIALLQWTYIHDGYIQLPPFKTQNKTRNREVIINMTGALQNRLTSIEKTDFYVLPGLAKQYNSKSATKPFSTGEKE